MVKKDKINHQKAINKIHIENNNTAGLYKSAKSRMVIKAGGKPTMFLLGREIITAPHLIANIQVNYFSEKVKKTN